jgi:hypothetical protein
MADLTVREVTAAGLAAADAAFYQAAAASQTIPAKTSTVAAGGYETESVFLLVRNTDAATRDVTVGAQAAVTVAATTGNAVIPVQSTGRNHAAIPITYSATANLNVALVRVGKGY